MRDALACFRDEIEEEDAEDQVQGAGGMESRCGNRSCVAFECNLLESREKAMYAVSTVRQVEIGGELRMKRAGLWATRAASIVCLLLITWMAFIQVTHVHPVASDTDHCPVCVAMHSAAPAAVVVEPVQNVKEPEALPAPVMRSVIRRWHFTLFNRPPPEQT